MLWCVGFERSSGSSRQAIWIDGLNRRVLNALPVRDDDHPRRILYTSSTSVYGNGDGQESTKIQFQTRSPKVVKPVWRRRDYCRNILCKLPHVFQILRLAGIYGPHRLLRRIEDLRSNTPITSLPDEWLNLIHVDDAVAAIDAVSRMESPPSLMNVVGNKSTTRGDYYRALAKLARSAANLRGAF